MNPNEVYSLFNQLGGQFSYPVEVLIEKLTRVKALVFDWDGVFNEGKKSPSSPSSFLEADSMGLNMLRYGFWLKKGQKLPICIILTGADNPTAQAFAQREHFHRIYSKVKDKSLALTKISEEYGLHPQQICYTFDDINDLRVAKEVGLRIQVNRPGSPLFDHYTQQQSLRDYQTAQVGGNFALREVAELLLGLHQVYEQVVASRSAFDAPYKTYWNQRQAIVCERMDAL